LIDDYLGIPVKRREAVYATIQVESRTYTFLNEGVHALPEYEAHGYYTQTRTHCCCWIAVAILVSDQT